MNELGVAIVAVVTLVAEGCCAASCSTLKDAGKCAVVGRVWVGRGGVAQRGRAWAAVWAFGWVAGRLATYAVGDCRLWWSGRAVVAVLGQQLLQAAVVA